MRPVPALGAALIGACLAVSWMPAAAQPAQDPPLPERMERALREMLEGVQPSLEDALEYLRSFGGIDDPRHYELPELLPNGDIIIRRREDAPPLSPETPDEPEGPPAEDLPYDPDEGVRT